MNTTAGTMKISKKVLNGTEREVIAYEDVPVSAKRGDHRDGDGCFLCNRKVGTKITYIVHMSVDGDLLPFWKGQEHDPNSQGCFQIGSECQKKLPKQFVTVFGN